MTTAAKATAKKGSFWTEEKAEQLSEIYLARLEKDGADIASSNDALEEIAKEIGAVSYKSVRGKLNNLGIYEKPEQKASQPKTNKLRKEHYIRAISNSLGLDPDDLDSLKNGKADSLELLAGKLGITDIACASKTGYEIEPAQMVYNFMLSNAVDFDDLTEIENAQ